MILDWLRSGAKISSGWQLCVGWKHTEEFRKMELLNEEHKRNCRKIQGYVLEIPDVQQIIALATFYMR